MLNSWYINLKDLMYLFFKILSNFLFFLSITEVKEFQNKPINHLDNEENYLPKNYNCFKRLKNTGSNIKVLFFLDYN